MLKLLLIHLLSFSIHGFSDKSGLCAVSRSEMAIGMGSQNMAVADGEWFVNVGEKTYIPGRSVLVTVKGPANATFRGILIYALTSKGGHIGKWEDFSDNFRTLDVECAKNGPALSTLCHANSNSKANPLTLKWTPPEDGAGNVTFRGLIVVGNRGSWATLGNFTLFGPGTAPELPGIPNSAYSAFNSYFWVTAIVIMFLYHVNLNGNI